MGLCIKNCDRNFSSVFGSYRQKGIHTNMSKIVVAFDLYGTLLSTESIAKQLASHFGDDKATSIAAVWRKYQLEYTWRLNSMSKT